MIRIYPDRDTLNRAAADLFVEEAVLAVASRGRFAVALSGGSTPRPVYELLGEPPRRDQVKWSKVHIFWGDERCVPLTDPRSNARMAKEAWLDKVPLPPDQVHPIDCSADPAAGARAYEETLSHFFGDEPWRFDLVFLGLGDNGHTASLFPGTPVLSETHRRVAEVYVAEQDMYRVTLTAPLLNQARLVVFLVAGSDKAEIVRRVLEGPRDPEHLPAQLIQPSPGELRWLIDKASAARLSL